MNTRRSRSILVASPAVLVVGIVLGQWTLKSLGIGVPKYTNVDLKALGDFAFNNTTGQTKDIPGCWRDLDGRRVSLNGFMFSPMSIGPSANLYQFVFDNHHSDFKPPLVQERVYATAPATMSVYDFDTPVRLDGVFHAGVHRDASGAIRSVFRMDVESVTPLAAIPASPPPKLQLTVLDILLLGYMLVGAFFLFTKLRHFRLSRRPVPTTLCVNCGYDLRATPARCPECGATPGPKGAA